MKRTQIQLSEDHHQQLRALSDRLGVSMAEMIRRCVADRLAREEDEPSRDERAQAALAVCGKYRDLGGDDHVAEEHDRHLAEAFGS